MLKLHDITSCLPLFMTGNFSPFTNSTFSLCLCPPFLIITIVNRSATEHQQAAEVLHLILICH